MQQLKRANCKNAYYVKSNKASMQIKESKQVKYKNANYEGKKGASK